ncbi:MAG: hypothetical protein V3S45_01915 [Kiloniellales bacterium]
MPPAIIATVLGVSLTAAQVISFAVSIALGFVSQALAGKPSRPRVRDPGSPQMVRSSLEAHQIIYGTVRVSGPLVFAEVSGAKNKFLHLVIPLAGHEVAAINSVFLNDVEIRNDQLDGDGLVFNERFEGRVRIKKHLGTDTQAADADLVSEVANWTTDHQAKGIAYIYLRLEWNRDTFPTGIPNVTVLVDGKKVWDPRADPGDPSVVSYSTNAALCALDFVMADFGFGVPLAEVHEPSWVAAANVCDEQVTLIAQAEDFTAVASTDEITLANDRNWGLGDVVRLTTTGTLPAGLALATDYFVIPSSKTVYLLAASLANALSRTQIDITDAGTGTHTVTRNAQTRYDCNGAAQLDAKPLAVLEDILTAMAGTAVYQQGAFRGYAAAATTSTGTLDEADLRGPIRVTPRPSRSSGFNAIRGKFVDASDGYLLTDFPPITNATFEAEDGGERVFKDTELFFTTNKTRAQRIANIHLLRGRQGIIVRFPAKLTKFGLAPWDVVDVTLDRLGWAAKEFRILEWALAEGGGVDLILQEEAARVYTWNPADEVTLDPAPDTNLPNPFTVAPPTGLTLTSGTAALFLKADGTVVSRIKAAWTEPDDIFVTDGGSVEVQFKKTADSTWRRAALTPGDATEAFVFEVEDGVAYDVRARSINALGVKSDDGDPWAATVTGHTVIGKTALPADVTGFSAAQNGNVVNFRWDQVADLDLGGYEIRYNPDPTSKPFPPAFEWSIATPLTEVTRGTAITSAQVPPGDWTFLIKAVDTSGNQSNLQASADATVVAEGFDVILQREQAPGWPGTLTGFVKHHTGVLVPDSQNLASDDGFETFDQFVVNPVASATYEAPEFVLSFDDTVRVWGTIISELGPGETTGLADPALEIDHRLNAGAYDGFEPWTIGNVEAGFIKLRLVLDTSIGVAKVIGFEPTVDLFERTVGGRGVVVGASGTGIGFGGKKFHFLPRVTVTVDGASALIATKSFVLPTGFTAHVFDTGGTEVGGTVDWQATGA